MRNLRNSLTIHWEKKFRDAQRLYNQSIGNQEELLDDADIDEQQEDSLLGNFPADFLDNILNFIYNMYQNEFEKRQAELSQEEDRNNFDIHQVFDENEV